MKIKPLQLNYLTIKNFISIFTSSIAGNNSHNQESYIRFLVAFSSSPFPYPSQASSLGVLFLGLSSNNQTYIISTTSFFGSNGRAGAEAEAGLGLGAGAGLEVRLRVGAEAGLGLGAEAGVGAEAGGGSSKQR